MWMIFKSLSCCGKREPAPRPTISNPLDNPKLRPISIQPPRAVPQRPEIIRLPTLTRLDSIEAAVNNAALHAMETPSAPFSRAQPDVPTTPSELEEPTTQAPDSDGSHYSSDSSHFSTLYG